MLGRWGGSSGSDIGFWRARFGFSPKGGGGKVSGFEPRRRHCIPLYRAKITRVVNQHERCTILSVNAATSLDAASAMVGFELASSYANRNIPYTDFLISH